jgi:hypothetical protein
MATKEVMFDVTLRHRPLMPGLAQTPILDSWLAGQPLPEVTVITFFFNLPFQPLKDFEREIKSMIEPACFCGALRKEG